jgi:hypothetical protein
MQKITLAMDKARRAAILKSASLRCSLRQASATAFAPAPLHERIREIKEIKQRKAKHERTT